MKRRRALVTAAVAAAAVGGVLGGYTAFGRGSDVESERCAASEYARYPRPHLDFSRDRGRAAPFLRGVAYNALAQGAGVDEIRAIDRPCFESPAEAAKLLNGTTLVIGVERGGEAHAYPVDLLSYHEVVNDVVGDDPIAVTWCPLCSSALAFDRRIDGRELHFAVSGLLYSANQVLFDRETGSLWSQLLGGAITGRYRGKRLKPVPLVEETWQAWRRQHPDAPVLSIRRDAYANAFLHPYSVITARGEHASNEPYDDYQSKVNVYYPQLVRGIRDAELVLGVRLHGRAKAYPLAALEQRRKIEDVVGGEPIVVTYDSGAFAASVFSRRTGARLPATESYWFAWRRFYPRTVVYHQS